MDNYKMENEFVATNPCKPIDYSTLVMGGKDTFIKPQAPALISGADALRALADGKDVEGFSEENEEWIPIVYFTVQEVVNGLYKFRLKPQTIKLELEIPAPYKAKIGGRDDASFVLNVGRHQYCYNNEEDYTKARDALESVLMQQ